MGVGLEGNEIVFEKIYMQSIVFIILKKKTSDKGREEGKKEKKEITKANSKYFYNLKE